MSLSNLKREISNLVSQYSVPLVIAGGVTSQRSQYLLELSEEFGRYVNVNKFISEFVLNTPRGKMPGEVNEVLSKFPFEVTEDVIFLDHIDILFSPQLKIAPLKALINLSRRKKVIVSWPGEYREGRLIYAEPGHPEYYFYDNAKKNCLIIEI